VASRNEPESDPGSSRVVLGVLQSLNPAHEVEIVFRSEKAGRGWTWKDCSSPEFFDIRENGGKVLPGWVGLAHAEAFWPILSKTGERMRNSGAGVGGRGLFVGAVGNFFRGGKIFVTSPHKSLTGRRVRVFPIGDKPSNQF
jgi:hypothetical protein